MSKLPQKSQFLIYKAENGAIKIDVRFDDETVWLTQQLMAELFQSSKQNIGQHLKNIFEEEELTQGAVVKNFFTTAADGKSYSTRFYNLDAIISVGYRIKSRVATQFRIWATQRLREYVVKGFVLEFIPPASTTIPPPRPASPSSRPSRTRCTGPSPDRPRPRSSTRARTAPNRIWA